MGKPYVLFQFLTSREALNRRDAADGLAVRGEPSSTRPYVVVGGVQGSWACRGHSPGSAEVEGSQTVKGSFQKAGAGWHPVFGGTRYSQFPGILPIQNLPKGRV